MDYDYSEESHNSEQSRLSRFLHADIPIISRGWFYPIAILGTWVYLLSHSAGSTVHERIMHMETEDGRPARVELHMPERDGSVRLSSYKLQIGNQELYTDAFGTDNNKNGVPDVRVIDFACGDKTIKVSFSAFVSHEDSLKVLKVNADIRDVNNCPTPNLQGVAESAEKIVEKAYAQAKQDLKLK